MVIETTELTWRDQIELEARRKDIRTIIEARFGHISSAVDATLEGTRSEEALDAFLRRAAVAPTEDDLLNQPT